MGIDNLVSHQEVICCVCFVLKLVCEKSRCVVCTRHRLASSSAAFWAHTSPLAKLAKLANLKHACYMCSLASSCSNMWPSLCWTERSSSIERWFLQTQRNRFPDDWWLGQTVKDVDIETHLECVKACKHISLLSWLVNENVDDQHRDHPDWRLQKHACFKIKNACWQIICFLKPYLFKSLPRRIFRGLLFFYHWLFDHLIIWLCLLRYQVSILLRLKWTLLPNCPLLGTKIWHFECPN